MTMTTKPLNQMTTLELENAQTRHQRMVNLYRNEPVEYKNNQPLTPELKAYYLQLSNLPDRLREAICDNIQLEGIRDIITWHPSLQDVWKYVKIFIKNRGDFPQF